MKDNNHAFANFGAFHKNSLDFRSAGDVAGASDVTTGKFVRKSAVNDENFVALVLVAAVEKFDELSVWVETKPHM